MDAAERKLQRSLNYQAGAGFLVLTLFLAINCVFVNFSGRLPYSSQSYRHPAIAQISTIPDAERLSESPASLLNMQGEQ